MVPLSQALQCRPLGKTQGIGALRESGRAGLSWWRRDSKVRDGAVISHGNVLYRQLSPASGGLHSRRHPHVRHDTKPGEPGPRRQPGKSRDFARFRARSAPRVAAAATDRGQIPDSDLVTSPAAELRILYQVADRRFLAAGGRGAPARGSGPRSRSRATNPEAPDREIPDPPRSAGGRWTTPWSRCLTLALFEIGPYRPNERVFFSGSWGNSHLVALRRRFGG